ncbi:hypothetical protein [Absidia glauca]|uniref:SWIM-type domain-containing protein n=1 Tax=Absidia glauca TaxID=4829 RepID=A0A163MMC8_ABSGL|nr:hypothetical protein [Absidia glauca]
MRTRQGRVAYTNKCDWKAYEKKDDQGWCVGKVILHDGSIIADRHVQGAVSVGKCEHNHALIADSSVVASVFPQARALDTKQVKTVASMLMAGSSASNVVDAMREDQGKTIKPKDVCDQFHQTIRRCPCCRRDLSNKQPGHAFVQLGDKSSKTFVAASASVLMVNETAINYNWALTTFKEVVWAGKNEEVNTKDCEKKTKYHKMINKLFYTSDEQALNETAVDLGVLFSSSRNEEKLKKHLNDIVGKDQAKVYKENASYMSQKSTEQRTNPVSIFNQPLFKNLLGRISHFALALIMKEFKNQKDNKHDDPACTCAISRNFGLPCRHQFPEVLVPDQIDQFWHLDCEKEVVMDHETALAKIKSLLDSVSQEHLEDIVVEVSGLIDNIASNAAGENLDDFSFTMDEHQPDCSNDVLYLPPKRRNLKGKLNDQPIDKQEMQPFTLPAKVITKGRPMEKNTGNWRPNGLFVVEPAPASSPSPIPLSSPPEPASSSSPASSTLPTPLSSPPAPASSSSPAPCTPKLQIRIKTKYLGKRTRNEGANINEKPKRLRMNAPK